MIEVQSHPLPPHYSLQSSSVFGRGIPEPLSAHRPYSSVLRQSMPDSSQSNGYSTRYASRAPSPVYQSEAEIMDSHATSKSSVEQSIHPHLQLPSTISSSKGSLTEFAAQVACLFWFESSNVLTKVEDRTTPPFPRLSLVSEATPTTGFVKWVTTILSTTQVTQNVTLLALMFIHRLKKQNPYVKGKPGSEFRLFTVALMLGNKFLDDNTYTNKTWAEVSGISVQEIHVMEVEFLSHMKYNLFTSKEEWDEWHQQLHHLWRYFNLPLPTNTSKGHALRHSSLHLPLHLPSPPASNHASPPYVQATPPNLSSSAYNPPSLPHLAPYQDSPTNSIPDLDLGYPGRKRSSDESSHEPPPKRGGGYDPYSAQRMTPQYMPPIDSYASGSKQLPNLAVPKLPMPTPHSVQANSTPSRTPGSSARPSANSLPPFQWPGSGGSQSMALPHPGLHVTASSAYDRSSRRSTPLAHTPTHGSPVAPTFPSSASHSTSYSQMSPSYFLRQRTSPYRPVRNISTLLVPPPSGQLQNPPQQVSYDQMAWQPLGKSLHDRRTGRVPYMHREAWPLTDQVEGWPFHYPAPMQ